MGEGAAFRDENRFCISIVYKVTHHKMLAHSSICYEMMNL